MTTSLDEILLDCDGLSGDINNTKKAILSWIEKEVLCPWPNKCEDCRTQMLERLKTVTK